MTIPAIFPPVSCPIIYIILVNYKVKIPDDDDDVGDASAYYIGKL